MDDNIEEYDAVVIGSGYGGSVAACRMSMAAGLKVCLVEKGRRWRPDDFPTNTFHQLSALRIESCRIRLGCKDALYQIHIQEDSAAAVACGLGGGSLINAGVMLPATVRARRNPKWPKEWEKDWEVCESAASVMLNIQTVPVKFQSEKIMEELTASNDLDMKMQGSLNLSINFEQNVEDEISGKKIHKKDSCIACGNCFGGCPYNAKNSTDKTYIQSAIKAGCVIKTEREVQYLVRNPDDTCEEDKTISKRKRWRIYFNDFDYITSDFVVVSAGVFGTNKILSKSQMRGLLVSESFGSGLSCNGNAIAYVSGSKAPLNAYALNKKQLSTIPFENRPGPSISSSFTSSLGFTIQSAVHPTVYPSLLFKGIHTYGWPIGYSFFHAIVDKLKQLFKQQPSHDIILNAIGHDESNGKISFDKDTDRVCFQTPNDPLLPRKIEAFQKLAKKLGGILFLSRFRSTSVHLLGGCCVSSNVVSGVCNPSGQVFDTKTPNSVHPGLYVCDASLIPCSIGINPCLTISTAAEHVSKYLVKDILNYKIKCEENPDVLHSASKPRLSMAAFPHVRKICNAGYIVDGHGNNSYLIHPERIAIPTLYISGGRPILVTPETTFLANNYMKLHHPGLRHERVVVDGFGHSDLLIGEESHKMVFPHILKHIGLAEMEKSGDSGNDIERIMLSKDALSWTKDPYFEDRGGYFSAFIFYFLIITCLFLCFKSIGFLIL